MKHRTASARPATRVNTIPLTARHLAPLGHRCTPDGQCEAGCGRWPCTAVLRAVTATPPPRHRPVRHAAKPRRPPRDWPALALLTIWLLLGAAMVWVLVLAARHPNGVLHADADVPAATAAGNDAQPPGRIRLAVYFTASIA
jgi:hypothetical protein